MLRALLPRFGRTNTPVSGGVILLITMTVVNGGNYLYNLILGHRLGPVAFADLSLIVTLMLVVTFITATLQLTAAKFAAIASADATPDHLANLRRWLGRWAWGAGGVVALALIAGAPVWQAFFRTQSPWPFVVLGVGTPIYFAQGVDRGILQGQMRFGRLSAGYLVEMLVRLGFGLAFVALGWGVSGAVLGIALSFVATWLVAGAAGRGLPRAVPLPAAQQRAILVYAGPVIVVHVSQILINNSDILIVRRFFAAEEAGLYAALALIGRVVFFATWSVVTALFPVVAQRHRRGESHRHLLWSGLAVVGGISGIIVLGTLAAPELIVTVLFGRAYVAIAPLLWLYAVATMLYALANVVVTYRLSADSRTGTYWATLAGIVQIAALWLFHASLRQVVLVQIAIMAALLLILLIWDWRRACRTTAETAAAVSL